MNNRNGNSTMDDREQLLQSLEQEYAELQTLLRQYGPIYDSEAITALQKDIVDIRKKMIAFGTS